eukprot:gene24741-10377_t
MASARELRALSTVSKTVRTSVEILTALGANAWCATVIAGLYGIEDSTACASYCVGQAKSQPPFCFDYRYGIVQGRAGSGSCWDREESGSGDPDQGIPSGPDRDQTTGLHLSDDYSKDLTSRPAPMDRSLSQDIYVAYNPEYHQPMSDAESRYAELLLEDGSFQGANMDTGAICGNGICEDGEDAELCAMDCCPATTCGDGKCQAYAVMEYVKHVPIVQHAVVEYVKHMQGNIVKISLTTVLVIWMESKGVPFVVVPLLAAAMTRGAQAAS